jgi:hypothetical protein
MKQLFPILFFLSLLYGTSLSGQNITGTVRNQQAEPIGFANVVLLQFSDSAFLAGTVTDDSGHFSLIRPGTAHKALLKVSSLGYVDVYMPVPASPVEVVLRDASYDINEVVVKGKVPPFKLMREGIATLVSGTSLSHIGSAMDVLSHIPGVYGKEGDFKVFGKGSPEIYINGKRLFNLSELDNLKSEDIKSVEVVTNPGARYNASVKSVIKISTKKPMGEGFGISLRSSYNQWENADFTEQVNWTYRHKKLDLFGNHSFRSENMRSQSELTQDVNADTLWHQDNQQLAISKSGSYQNNVGFNYQFNKNNSVGAKYSIIFRSATHETDYLTSRVTANGDLYDLLEATNLGVEHAIPSHRVNAYYRGNASNMSWGIDADYLYDNSRSAATNNEQSTYEESRAVNTFSRTNNELFASKLTWGVNTRLVEMTFGLEYSFTKRKSRYDNPEGYVDGTNTRIEEQHASPFAELNWQLGRWTLNTGVRYEQVWYEYREGEERVDNQSRRFGNLFPNLSLQTQLGPVQMMLGYVVKTRRPSYSELSDEITYANRFTYQSGNSKLGQETIHDLSLAATWNFLQFSVSYNDRRNAILYWADAYNESGSITLVSRKNIPSLKSMLISVAAAPTIGPWKPVLTVGLSKQWYDVKTLTGTVGMNNPVAMFSLSNTLKFGKNWMAVVDLSYTTRGDEENCSLTRSVFTADASLYRYFFQKKLSLRLGIDDMFHSQKNGNALYFYQLRTTQMEWHDSREVSLTVRYSFNVGKNKYKGTGAGNSEKERL